MTATERLNYALDTVYMARQAAADGRKHEAERLYRSAEAEVIEAAAIDTRNEVGKMAVECAARWAVERHELKGDK